MPSRPVVVTATPEAGHWQLSIADGHAMGCETLRQATKVARRLAGTKASV